MEQTCKSFEPLSSELLSNMCNRFANDTRKHILILLFRLTVDVSLTADAVVSSELKSTIVALLDVIPAESVEDTVRFTSIIYKSKLTPFRCTSFAQPPTTPLRM